MNLSIDKSARIAASFHVVTKNPKKETKTDEEKRSPQQQQIDRFKEEHSRENTKKAELLHRFRAGQKLTSEELEYLAKESPETYRQIKEIIMERQAMEAQMQRAETKEEVEDIHLNQVNKIKATMGTGEEAKRQAQKTMARVNQTDAAYIEFTSSLEYKEKESITEETRKEDSHSEENFSKEGLPENPEKANREDYRPEEPTSEEPSDERPKIHPPKKKMKKEDLPPEPFVFASSVEYETLRQKVRDLYHTESKTAVTTGSGLDISL